MATWIDCAITSLRKGPADLPELERVLGYMTADQRRVLVARVKELNLPAPQCVFYDYKRQKWIE